MHPSLSFTGLENNKQKIGMCWSDTDKGTHSNSRVLWW